MRTPFITTYDPKDPGDSIGPGWEEVINGREVGNGWFCDFEFAEESIACFFFKDGSVEVGIGEPLRPYQQLYAQSSKRPGTLDIRRLHALRVFLDTVQEHASW